MPAYAAWAGGRHGAPELLAAAEKDGFLPESCSYHRAHMGLLANVRDGVAVREDMKLPIPDIMFTAPLCPEMGHLADSVYRRFGVPVVSMHCPTPHREADLARHTDWMERELREVVVPALEQVCGRPFNYERLREVLIQLKEMAMLRNECWEFFKRKPAPWTLWDYIVSMGPFVILAGEAGGVEYYKELKAELEERVAQGIPALSEEKHRVYWDALCMYGWFGVIARKLANLGINAICGRYPWELFPRPWLIDTEGDPIRAMAELIGEVRRVYASELYPQIVSELVEEYQIDGLIMFAFRTCKNWSMGQQDVMIEIERKLGVPGILLDADGIDPRYYSDAQIDTRFQALAEMMEARKRLRQAANA
jgi:benzoyl-CoA reductase/2-hydroxyglutaryl-CoA dehydratase subunit BcrC/BadD/HgdB